MVRKKKERTRAKFTGVQMTAAVREVKINGTPLRIAADMFDVNFVTLRRYVLKERNDPNTKMEPNYAVRSIFSTEQERSLSEYIKTCSKMAFGLNTQKVRELAYEMALRNNINMPDSWRRNKCASKDWLRAFIKRTASLSIRKPEACSLSRLTSFTKPNVERFFLQLEKIYGGNPAVVQEIQIYNLDETATTTVQRPHKVVTQKGVKQLNQCTSAERGLLATTCAIIRANGTFLPPIIIFPRKKFVPHMLNGAPPGTLGLANPSGWMTAELFVEVLNHFIKHTGVTKERPCLLIYDNHESHMSLEIAEKAKNNGIIILTLPPHTSNKLQPLDKAVFYSFKNFYNGAIDSWLLTHPAVPMTLYQIAECVGIAHSKSMTPENILNGFRSTGIYPFNKHIFTEADFLVSSVTDRPEDAQKENLQQGMVVVQENLNDEQDPGGSGKDTAVASCSTTDPQQCADDKEDSSLEIASTSKDSFTSPFEIWGFPKAAPRKNLNRTRKSKKSVILTSTPEMKKLSYKTEKKKTPKTEAVKRVKRNLTADKKDTRKKSKTCEEDSETDTESVDLHFADSSDDELTLAEFQCHMMQEEKEQSEFLAIDETTEILKDSFVLVKFQNNIHYVAKILEAVNSNEFKISYLRKSAKVSNSFYFPDVPDIHMALKLDFTILLPNPIKTNNKRLSSYFKFGVDFGNMIVR